MVFNNNCASPDTFNNISTVGRGSNYNSKVSNKNSIYSHARKEILAENLLNKFENQNHNEIDENDYDSIKVKEVRFCLFKKVFRNNLK